MTLAAVVLAAGSSARFREAGLPHKLGVAVNGLPLVAYPLASLSLAGAERIVVVASEETLPIVSRAAGILGAVVPRPPCLDVVVNEHPERGNGHSFVEGVVKAGLEGCLLVSMADHVYPPSLAEELLAAQGPAVGADSSPRYVDVGEATRILVSDGGIEAIGKHLARYTHVDIGVHRVPAEAAYLCGDAGGVLEFSAVLQCMAAEMRVSLVDVAGAPWTEIDTPRDLEELVSGRRRRVLEEVVREWRERGARPG